VKLYCISGKKC